jgi:hypothetical protein
LRISHHSAINFSPFHVKIILHRIKSNGLNSCVGDGGDILQRAMEMNNIPTMGNYALKSIFKIACSIDQQMIVNVSNSLKNKNLLALFYSAAEMYQWYEDSLVEGVVYSEDQHPSFDITLDADDLCVEAAIVG